MVNTLSIIIPVYRNEESIPSLLKVLSNVSQEVEQRFNFITEIVFVVDGSPDDSYALLGQLLPQAPFKSQLLLHSRNFGAFSAIRSGLKSARGHYFAVMAADLQEPPGLVLEFLDKLNAAECDVVIGCRAHRHDPLPSRLFSNIFWKMYKKFIMPEIPEKGFDVFGCNELFRNHLIQLNEANSSLVGQIYWLGFRRSEVMYSRQEREFGKSAWTFKKKVNYLLDSVFSFTDLPIRLLSLIGILGLFFSIIMALVVVLAKIIGDIPVPGYAATVLTIIFFGGLNSLGLGIVGTYAWRAYENTKGRPLAIMSVVQQFGEEIVKDEYHD